MHQTSNFVFWIVSFTEDFLHPENHNPNKNGEPLPPHPGCNGHHQDDMKHFLGPGIPTQTLHLCAGCNHGKWRFGLGFPSLKMFHVVLVVRFASLVSPSPSKEIRPPRTRTSRESSMMLVMTWMQHSKWLSPGRSWRGRAFFDKKHPKCQVNIAFFPKYTRLFLCLGVVK